MPSLTCQIINEAVKRFETPVYLYDATNIKNKYWSLRNALTEHCAIYYSMKANPLLAINKILKDTGAGCEVSSGNELKTALKVGFLPEKIILVGPGKKHDEIECAIKNNIKHIVCESMDEILSVNTISEKYQQKTSVLIRINPDFMVLSAPIKMGGVPTQFGMTQSELL